MNLYADTILEYLDGPQLLIARDDFDTMYLCLAYDDNKFTAIRISAKRIHQFEKKEVDLLYLFLNPENVNEYFDVTIVSDSIKATPIHSIDVSRLPAAGFYLSEPLTEKITVAIPSKDKSLFSSVIKRFGWVAM